jgi:hypothetical protein
MQKLIFNLFYTVLVSLTFCACKKELTSKAEGTSALTVVNGIVSDNYLFANFNGAKSADQYYSATDSRRMVLINYGEFKFFNSYHGLQDLGFYQLPDTNFDSKPVLRLSLELPVNAIHTLFLAGTPQDPDYFTTTNQLPYHLPSDSTMGLRFVNLSKGSTPVSVNLIGQANSEVANLSYKGVSTFKNYPAGSAISSYTFEFRDQLNGTLLGTCIVDGVNNDGSPSMPNRRRSRNYTLALLAAPFGMNRPGRILIVDEAPINP